MRTRLAIAAAAGLALLGACSSAPAQMTVHGTVRVVDNEPIDPLPVNFGTQVTVTDPSSKIIGVGHLGDSNDHGRIGRSPSGGQPRSPRGNPPTASTSPGLDGTTQFTQAQMEKGPAVCAGDACQ